MKLTSALLLLTLLPGIAAEAQSVQATNPAWSSSQPSLANALHVDSGSNDGNGSSGMVRPIPVPKQKKQRETFEARPFSTVALSLKANTQGVGFEMATPLAPRLNLRTGINGFAFGYPFTIDGVNYDARLHLRSAQASVDWFPWRRHGFHISPGLLYMKDALGAPSSVAPGQYFELGDNGFVNSVDDPVHGTASLVFPRNYSPMLTVGFGNLIPRDGHRFSIPFEIGAAYTGAAIMNVTLNGTACTDQGCFSFAANQDAQSSLQQEIQKINRDLKKVPIYPIISLGFGYRF